MTNPVPAPEQQGDRKAWIRREMADAHALMKTIPAWLLPPSQRREPQVTAEEQQGEPVCAKVQGTGTTWVCSRPKWYFMHSPEWSGWGKPGTGWHEFELPAPPSSEEAEAQWERYEVSQGAARWVLRDRPHSSRITWVPVEIEAAIRRPLEERVRELERTVAELDADREPLKERAVETYNMMVALEVERDRALKLRDAFREVSIDLNREKEHERAKWLEEVERRADAEEERDRLREALTLVVLNPMNYLDWLSSVECALAETVQEGGDH